MRRGPQHKICFVSEKRPTKDQPGVTRVFDNITPLTLKGNLSKAPKDVDRVEIGQIVKPRGVNTFEAFVMIDTDESDSIGTYTSRSQAGHAIQAMFEADARSTKQVAREQKAALEAVAKAERADARATAKAEKAEAAAKAKAEKAEAAKAKAEKASK